MANPYDLWNTRKLLGVFRATEPAPTYWIDAYQNQILVEDEYIDFEKLPVPSRKLAAFALPLARGKSVYDDRARTYRVKPAYIKLDDEVDPLKPLRMQPGIDASMLEGDKMDPMRRTELLKAAIAVAHRRAYDLRLDWMAAKATIDGKITLTGEDYPTTLVDFGRSADHTIVLGAGERFGDANVSAFDFFQEVVDLMSDAEFGGVPVKATMGGSVWAYLRGDAEFLAHMDKDIRGERITIERGLTAGKIFKVGEMLVGGASGQKIELWVNNEVYIDPETGASTRYLGAKDIVFEAAPDALEGYRCFGRIIDKDARYAAVPIFPKNYTQQVGDITVERVSHKSAPLILPVNPDATLKATVLG